MLCSAAVCLPTASFDNAVCWLAYCGLFLKINRLGASNLLLLGVVALAKGITLAGEPRLDKGVA
jgi:hypothetical protein